jgi:hypothetical protein
MASSCCGKSYSEFLAFSPVFMRILSFLEVEDSVLVPEHSACLRRVVALKG